MDALPPRRTACLAPLALVASLVALLPLSLAAANPFNDLNAGSPHNANIDAIYVAGVTRGCDPDVGYCPNGLVTREEMASFLARLGGLGTNPPVAIAKTVPDGAITPAKLGAAGSTAGQVLTSTGTAVTFRPAPASTLTARTKAITVPAMMFVNDVVLCLEGERVMGGGFNLHPDGSVQIVESSPVLEEPQGWRIRARNTSGAEKQIAGHAICTSP